MRALAIVAALLCTACGSAYKKHDDASKPAPDTTGLRLSDDSSFGARFEWTKGPMVCDDASKQSEGRLTLLTADGAKPATVTGVNVTPWMKIHGHGTGRWQPTLVLRPATLNEFDVTGLCFIMSGPWELNIDATVNGVSSKLEWTLEVP
jgi:hypothetical protein